MSQSGSGASSACPGLASLPGEVLAAVFLFLPPDDRAVFGRYVLPRHSAELLAAKLPEGEGPPASCVALTARWAAQRLPLANWAVRSGGLDASMLAKGAARDGHLEVLQWACENGGHLSRDTCGLAALGGHLALL